MQLPPSLTYSLSRNRTLAEGVLGVVTRLGENLATSIERRWRGHSGPSVTRAPPKPPGLTSVLERNIAVLHDRRRRDEDRATAQERLAEAITRFTGSMLFVYLHLAFLGS